METYARIVEEPSCVHWKIDRHYSDRWMTFQNRKEIKDQVKRETHIAVDSRRRCPVPQYQTVFGKVLYYTAPCCTSCNDGIESLVLDGGVLLWLGQLPVQPAMLLPVVCTPVEAVGIGVDAEVNSRFVLCVQEEGAAVPLVQEYVPL